MRHARSIRDTMRSDMDRAGRAEPMIKRNRHPTTCHVPPFSRRQAFDSWSSSRLTHPLGTRVAMQFRTVALEVDAEQATPVPEWAPSR
jgi:hypothetical protein